MAIEVIPVAEFQARMKAQGALTREDVAFTCVICGTVQSIRSLIAAGAPPEKAENQIGFSCEGRWLGSGPFTTRRMPGKPDVRGCDWTLGGLFTLHKIVVVTEDGKQHPRFALASADETKALAATLAETV